MAPETHTRQESHASAPRTLIYILFGPIVWALHLLAVYGSHAVLCARGATGVVLGLSLPGLAILAATAAALALLLVAILAPDVIRRAIQSRDAEAQPSGFHRNLLVLLAMLSAFGVIWAGAAALLLPACAQLR